MFRGFVLGLFPESVVCSMVNMFGGSAIGVFYFSEGPGDLTKCYTV